MKQQNDTGGAMNQELLERLWRGDLTASERARVLRQGGAQGGGYLLGRIEEEEALNRLISQNPGCPVSTNFTSRVMEAVRLEQTRATREARKGEKGLRGGIGAWLRGSWVAQVLATGLVVALGVGSMVGVRNYERRQLARSLEVVRDVAALSELELLRDFETIRQLGRVVEPSSSMESDAALLAALQ